MDVHSKYMVYQIYSFLLNTLFNKEIDIYYVHTIYITIMVRRMKAIIIQIESIVTPSGNSGHVVVPKAWIEKEVIVMLKEAASKGKRKK